MEYIAKDRSSLPPPLNLADIKCCFKCLCRVMHSVVIIILILITIIVIFFTIISIVITTTTIIITVIFFVIIIIAVIETFPLFIPGKKQGISRRPLQGKAKRGKRVVESCYIHPSLSPSLPSILSFIMIANIFYLPLNSIEDFHNQASCVPISAPILGTQQLRIFSRYSNSKSKQRYSVALCRLGRNESFITTCAHSFG